ncbi:MAG: thioesterase family protein [Ahrensia sp.]|nr:thioesterase family protein [Ahrensia sp.]
MIEQDGQIWSPLMQLEPEWIDYNGHLNMAYYNVLFDRGCDAAFEQFGMGPDYAKTRQLTIYTAEIHVRYLREIHLRDKVRSSYRIVDHDEKRLHAFQELRHEDGWLSATSETLTLHVDMTGPKVTPFPEDVQSKIDAIAQQHVLLPMPEETGRRIEIRKKAA